MAFVTLPKQLCTGEGDDALVRTVLGWIEFDDRVDQGQEADLHPIILGWSASGSSTQVHTDRTNLYDFPEPVVV